jgi:diguanylate cyclase (GGDEF)-like protein/PAS domain S-box-containing protein
MATGEHPASRWARARVWITDWGNALAVLLVIYCAGYISFQLSHRGSETLRFVAAHLSYIPLNLGTAVLAFRAASRAATDRRIRRSLALFGLCFSLIGVSNILLFYIGVVRDGDSLNSWVNLVALSCYFIALVAFLSMPMARRVEGEYWKFVLDAAVVMVGGGLAMWFFVFDQSLDWTTGGNTGRAIALAYPLCSLLLFFGVVTVILRRPADIRRWAPGLLFVGWLLYLMADFANDIVVQDVGFYAIGWLDYMYIATYCLLVWSFRQYYWRVPEVRTQPEVESPIAQPQSPLPYAAIAVTYGLVLWAAAREWPRQIAVLTVGAAIVALFVLLRQILAVRENVRLLDERAARETERRLSALVQRSSDVIAIVDPKGMLHYTSPSVTRNFGYAPDELDGVNMMDLIHPDDHAHANSLFLEVLKPHAVAGPVEWRGRHADGSWRNVEVSFTNLMDEPSVHGIVVNARDVSDRKALQAQLTHQAFHDQLTGLANRALFLDRVTHALTLARRHQQKLALIFLDIDNFKTVNDSLGHGVGDRLLTIAAQRLLASVRTADTVARLGGDEFAVLLEDAEHDSGAIAVVERIVHALRHPFSLDGREVFATASIGVAIAGEEETSSDLVRNADMAMYLAKRDGKARYQIFEPQMHTQALERLELEADMRRAIDREEFVVHYQPIVLLHTGEITGVEALVRWQHPRKGMIGPPLFIPIAEETGLIVPLGRWVVRDACRQAQRWQAMRGVPLTLTVNISGYQLQGESVVDDVRGALADSGLDPRQLVLEITESVLMQHNEILLERLRALKAIGVRLAIDDFGTGYSSLGYLQRFPIDILKIDKSFVDNVGMTGGEPALARAVIALGETLRLQTIAEGIEQRRQLNGLQELGCEMGQGYYFARPVAASAIDAILAGESGTISVPPYERLVTRREGAAS